MVKHGKYCPYEGESITQASCDICTSINAALLEYGIKIYEVKKLLNDIVWDANEKNDRIITLAARLEKIVA